MAPVAPYGRSSSSRYDAAPSAAALGEPSDRDCGDQDHAGNALRPTWRYAPEDDQVLNDSDHAQAEKHADDRAAAAGELNAADDRRGKNRQFVAGAAGWAGRVEIGNR